MKKLYTKPEVDLIDLTAKESLMVTEYGFPGGEGVWKDDFYLDATSVNGYEDNDNVW